MTKIEFHQRHLLHPKARVSFQLAAGYYLGSEFGLNLLDSSKTTQFLSKSRFGRAIEFPASGEFLSGERTQAAKAAIETFRGEHFGDLRELQLRRGLQGPFKKLAQFGSDWKLASRYYEDNLPARQVLVDEVAQGCLGENQDLVLDCFEDDILFNHTNNWGRWIYLAIPTGLSFLYLRDYKMVAFLGDKSNLSTFRAIGKIMFGRGHFEDIEKTEAAFDAVIGQCGAELEIIRATFAGMELYEKGFLVYDNYRIIATAMEGIFKKMNIGFNEWFSPAFLLQAVLRYIYSGTV